MPEINDPNISPNVVPASFSNIPTSLTQKGIYFWFADEEGLEKLLQPLSCKVIDRHFIMHNGKKLFLIYIGTAGTGKGKKNQLFGRLEWHLNQKHIPSVLRNKSLSNLRQAIGLLLRVGLEGEGSRKKINSFMEKHLCISWTPMKMEIGQREKLLIKTYYPFLNDDYNDKGYKNFNGEYSTKSYKELKAKYRANFMAKYSKNIKKDKNLNTMENKRAQMAEKDDSGCFLIEFKDTDNLHEVVNKYPGLEGPVFLEFTNKRTPFQTFYEKKIGKDPRRGTGTKGQNIYGYFRSDGSTTITTTGKKYPKWKEVQIEMEIKGIKNAILKICPQDNSAESSIDVASKPKISSGGGANETPVTLENIDFERMKGKPKLLILPCSDSKIPGGVNLPPEQRIDTFNGNIELNNFRQIRRNFLHRKMETNPKDFEKRRNRNKVGVGYFQKALINGPYLPVIERYSSGILYNNGVHRQIVDMVASKDLKVLFVSAFYGILEYNDHIIDYHLVLNGNGFPKKNLNIIQNQIDEYRIKNEIKESNVFALLNKAYSSVLSKKFSNLWISVHNGTADLYENKPILEKFLTNL